MKNTPRGCPTAGGLAAPESEFNSRTYPLATANIVTKLKVQSVALQSKILKLI